MLTTTRTRDLASFLMFAMLIFVPSLDTVFKYTELTGIVVYLIAGSLALFALIKFFLPLYLSRITERQALIIAVAGIAVLSVVVFFFLYPLANSGRLGGGTDVDDAMIVGVGELLKGNYPYYRTTYLGLPVSPMPGIFLLAAPFVLANAIALQNMVWVTLLFVVGGKYLDSKRSALVLIAVAIALAPTVMQNLATGSDYVSNAIYVLLAMWMMLRNISRPEAPEWKKILLSVFLGIALCSRSNFMLCIPILFSALVQTAGWRSAIKYMIIAGASFAILTLPFYFYDPAGFTPLTAQSSRLRSMNDLLPYSGIAVVACSYLITIGLSFQRMDRTGRVLFRNCAIMQCLTSLTTSILFSIATGRVDLDIGMGSAGYGMFTLFFAVVAGWMTLERRESLAAAMP